MKSNAFDSPDHDFPVAVSQSSHHSHVNPDNFAICDLYVPGMRIGMKKAIFHHLLDKAVYEFLSDLIEVIATRPERSDIIDRTAFYVFHHQNMICGKTPVQLWASDIFDIFIVPREFIHVGFFFAEIHLFLSDRPHLVEDHIKVDQVLQISHRRKEPDCFVKKNDISRHRFIYTFSLDLYYDIRISAISGSK